MPPNEALTETITFEVKQIAERLGFNMCLEQRPSVESESDTTAIFSRQAYLIRHMKSLS
jgi:hypothetical protein